MDAANDSGGLKIAVAVLIPLTVILAAASYFLYSDASALRARLDSEREGHMVAKRAAELAVRQYEELRHRVGTNAVEYDAVQRVRAADIGNGVEIIGSLGLPLSKVVTIQGEWSKRDASGRELIIKETWLMFVVSTVNGKRLEKPVDFRGFLVTPIMEGKMEDLRPEPGDVWELRGVELGRYYGVPTEVFGELGPPENMRAAAPYNFGFGFYTEFHYIKRRVVGHGQGRSESKTGGFNQTPAKPKAG